MVYKYTFQKIYPYDIFFFWSRVTYVYKIWPFLTETTELLSFSIWHFVSSFQLLFWALKVLVKIILVSMKKMCVLTAYQNASLPVTSQTCSCTLTPGSTSRMWFLKSAPMVQFTFSGYKPFMYRYSMHDLPTLPSPIMMILKLYRHIAPGSLKIWQKNPWEPIQL